MKARSEEWGREQHLEAQRQLAGVAQDPGGGEGEREGERRGGRGGVHKGAVQFMV